MQKKVTKILAIATAIIFSGCCLKAGALDETIVHEKPSLNENNKHYWMTRAVTAPHVQHNAFDVLTKLGSENGAFYHTALDLGAKKAEGKTRLLALGKATAVDPFKQQERSRAAVNKVVNAAKAFQPDMVVDKIAENVLSKEDVRRGVPEHVTSDLLRERLKNLSRNASPQDTVIIYTHSHGRKAGFEASQPLGGIVMDLPVRKPEHRGTLLWDEYVELILEIPAKNVVVLTMSCFSGGLVEYMNTSKVRTRWHDRQKQGRNLIVMTSQNKESPSKPIVKDGEIINPFTYAVVKAFEGEADGFKLEHGQYTKSDHKDDHLTVGEIVDYILYTTENVHSESAIPQHKNTARPQVTGSFNRKEVLLTKGKVTSKRDENNNSAQPDTEINGDKLR
ncbi:MAG: hypothetical protein CR997_08555 [Acidobacteria bacterium]|nr:MAG: hypothetical protein CR997_08555 [Acidobacteriota bacterium]